MTIQSIKTEKVLPKTSLLDFLDRYLPKIEERSIVVITSKIISLCQNAIEPITNQAKEELIKKEADYYLPASSNSYGITLTITNNILIPSAGIDESNANGCYVLWPRDVQRTANQLRIHFKEKHRLHEVGVIITDSTTTPLRRGTTGISISHSGFSALNSYVDQPDIFDKPMRVTQANVGNGLASAAVVVMGEGSEQTPLAIINDTPFVAFQDRNPTNEELNALTISLDDDLYGPVLRAAPWLKV